MFIIDFDDTLFDTHRFKDRLKEALQSVGVSTEDVDWSYQAAYSTAGKFTHSNNRRAELLAERGYDLEKVMMALAECMTVQALEAQVLPGAIELLLTLKKLNEPLVLLSLGDPDYQALKVRGSGVAKYFDRMFMVSDTKEQVVAELLTKHQPTNYWLINDKVVESKNLLKTAPQLRVVLKQSARIAVEEYAESGLPFFASLSEIQKYILENYGK